MKNTKNVSSRTLLVRRQQNIARSVIYIFTALTLIFLVWIVSYIMFKGFYYQNDVQYPVTSLAENIVELEEGHEIVFIVHKRVRTESVSLLDLRTLFTKPRKQENWGFYTEQDLESVPFAFKSESGWNLAAMQFLVPAIGEEFPDYVQYVRDSEEMIRRVSLTEGGIGYIPFDDLYLLEGQRKVKILGIRRYVLAVNPQVLVIRNNAFLRNLKETDLEMALTGNVPNWKDVGGYDLPLSIRVSDSIKDNADVLSKNGFGLFFQQDLSKELFLDKDECLDFLNEHSGAAVLVPYEWVLEHQLSTVPILVREKGLNLTLPFIFEASARSGKWGGISYIIINTILMILFTLLFSVPVGIMSALFLVEYAKQGTLVKILRMGTETLAGIPSIIFGLFGFIFFVDILKLRTGFISSTLSVTLMILPTIVRTTEESLKSVPDSYRQGALALGSSKLQTIFKVVLPAAMPGILTGIILAIGRTVGETAVLLYTLGSNMDIVRGARSSARVLSLHLYMLFSEAISFDRAFATGAVLIIIVLLVNFAASRIVKKMNTLAGTR